MQEKARIKAYDFYYRLWSLYGQIEEKGVEHQIKSQIELNR